MWEAAELCQGNLSGLHPRREARKTGYLWLCCMLGEWIKASSTNGKIGSVVIVLHAPADKEVETVDEILEYATQPGQYHASVRGHC